MNKRKFLSPANIDALASGSLADPSVAGLSIEIRGNGGKFGAIVAASPTTAPS